MDDGLPTRDPAAGRRRPVGVPVRATRAERPTGAAPPQWHRGLTVIAVISLFIGTRALWTEAIASGPVVAAVVTVCYAGILVCGVLALSVRGRLALAAVDLGVLALAVALVICNYWLDHSGSDEGVLTAQAANAILHGRPVYGQPWPWLFDNPRVGVTKTMSGGADYTYAYPPLTALLAAPVHAVVHSTAAATLVTTAALLIGTVTLWALLPAPWRPAVTAVCLGFGLLPAYARQGYPALVALAFLVPAVVRWHNTGAGGRLGRYGVFRAVCVGAACSSQQLAWFLLPFLLIGIHAVRRGELGGRTALGVTARYAGTAVLTWAALNAYFAADGFRDWAEGSLLPFTQGAILHGQGAMGISFYFTDGSSRLNFYSYASVLLLLGLLGATLLFARRLGPALTVLPWLPFYLATRSQDGYFLLMTPLWLAAAATVPASALATAWQPRIPRVRVRRAKAAVAAALVVPSLLCLTVAAASPPPLRMSVTPRLTDRPHLGVASVRVRAVNTTGHALSPHFAGRIGQGTSGWWTVHSGPATIAPHGSASYVVSPPGGFRRLPRNGAAFYLIAVSDRPMTITTAELPSVPTAHPRSRPARRSRAPR
ncbi:hypothetical protein [Streptomyces sp. NBC_00859]|uniref:hypothetical protein n=1 Tax=Streptomyces sp. NBC_00859 TaxID=2903682 RepID=UPI0038646C67|nr:hypothetical protein OG584_32725 [Streptomyces sp. NBC_00859]